MTSDIYSNDEKRLLTSWFEGRSLSSEDEGLLAAWGFDHDPCEAYTRLDAWVGAFAVRDIQERLPNCGISRDHGVVLTRPIVKNRRSKRVASAVRFLFGINWADSAPGLSWPADYHLIWLPGFERWVLTYSADSPDAMGYCDFALGAFGVEDDWREAVRKILVEDWRFQYAEWDQAPWTYVWRPGLVTENEALAWRKEAWAGNEDIAEEMSREEDADLEEDEEEEVASAAEATVPFKEIVIGPNDDRRSRRSCLQELPEEPS